MLFYCSYSRSIWLAVMSYNLIRDPQIFLDEVVVWGEQE